MSSAVADFDRSDCGLRAANYDLSATLFASGRLFSAPLDRGHVLFNPDRRGLPIVVANWVVELVDEFADGASVGAALSRLPSDVGLDEALDVTEYLERRGYLRY